MSQAIIFLIRAYQFLFSPLLHSVVGPTAGCRYATSCSEYTIAAIRKYGIIRGIGKGAKRILTCI